LGWLRQRLGEANRQENRILQRLGQLVWEIQEDELRRERDEYEPQRTEWAMQSFYSQQPAVKEDVRNSRLDATVPEFRPMNWSDSRNQRQYRMPVENGSWGQPSWQQFCHQQHKSSDYFGGGWIVEKKSEDHPQLPVELSGSHAYQHEVSLVMDDDTSPGTNTPTTTNPTSNRNPNQMISFAPSSSNYLQSHSPISQRASSLSVISLDILDTNTTGKGNTTSLPRWERNSLSSLPGIAKVWGPTKEENMMGEERRGG
jgi:hypothetical protein